MWAANSVWDAKQIEFLNIDTSSYMNRLAELIIRSIFFLF